MAGRTAEVNSSVLLCKTLWDGNTGKGVRARVFDATGTEVAESPFTLTHRAGGHYSGSGWTPTVEGQYSVSYEIHTNTGFTAADLNYEWDGEAVEVRSIDQDLQTLLSRLTSDRAGNLDRLDAAVSTRASQVSVNVDVCRMSTTLGSADGTQEVIVWLERNGTPLSSTSDARVAVKSTEGDLLWEADLLSPNADGVFAFSMPFVPPDADRSYYIEIVINDGTTDVSGRAAFITVG